MAKTQTEELRELIREANGVRGDLERATREAKKVGAAVANEAVAEIEETISKELDESRKKIVEGTAAALTQVSESVRELWQMLMGKRPVPKHVAEAMGASGYGNIKRVFYPDVEKIIRNWDTLNEEQQHMVQACLAAAAGVGDPNSRTTPIVLSAKQLPAPIRDALRSFK